MQLRKQISFFHENNYTLIMCGDPSKELYTKINIKGPREVIVFGNHRDEIQKCLTHKRVQLFSSLKESLIYLKDTENILFSPGYPSGKDYKNFEERGAHFNHLQLKRFWMTDKNSLLILIPFICLMSLGLVMVASSSIYVADDLTGNPFHFASRQMLFVSIGLLSMSLFLIIPSDLLYKFDWIFMLNKYFAINCTIHSRC